MFTHYLIIALRNMRRFKLQTIVCVTGLAVGMTCFALGTLWLRFIQSFEDFVPDGDNIFLVMSGEGKNLFSSGFYYQTPKAASDIIAQGMPGVEAHSHIIFRTDIPDMNICQFTVGEQTVEAATIFTDTAYLQMFGIEAEEGSLAHLRDGEMVLTRSAAKRLFGNNSALGESVKMQMPIINKDPVEQLFSVVAVIADRPQNTQFRYEVLACSDVKDNPNEEYYSINSDACTFVKFVPTVPRDSIVGKHELKYFDADGDKHERQYTFVPLTQLRSEFPSSEVKVGTSYVRWFMSLGLLVIFCSLANYLITMVSHLRRRGWEMSLRRVLGSSRAHIIYMVSIETLLILLLATLLAVLLTWIVLPAFREYSGITIEWSDIAQRLATYLALVIVCGMALSSLTAWIVMNRAAPLPVSLKGRAFSILTRNAIITPPRGSEERGCGVLLQMALSMGIIFCAVVMLEQVRMLTYSNELGFAHIDRGVVYFASEELLTKIQQSPLTVESHSCDFVLFPRSSCSFGGMTTDEKTRNDRDSYISQITVLMHKDMFDFYDMSLVCGELPVYDKYKDLCHDGHNVIEIAISETMCKKMGCTPANAIGTSLWNTMNEYRISGVIKDVYVNGPTVEPDAIVFAPIKTWDGTEFVFRSQPGRIAELCDSIREWAATLDEEGGYSGSVYNCETTFERYIQSEMMLIKILFAVGEASLFVCVIGTFSLVSLSLQQRRKEIAIRKVHGARLKDIMRLFLRGKVLSLALAALVAYPVAYIIMRHWLEGYQKQVRIDWWLIPATFLAIAAVVLGTITIKIWRAAKESTVEALNS